MTILTGPGLNGGPGCCLIGVVIDDCDFGLSKNLTGVIGSGGAGVWSESLSLLLFSLMLLLLLNGGEAKGFCIIEPPDI